MRCRRCTSRVCGISIWPKSAGGQERRIGPDRNISAFTLSGGLSNGHALTSAWCQKPSFRRRLQDDSIRQAFRMEGAMKLPSRIVDISSALDNETVLDHDFMRPKI